MGFWCRHRNQTRPRRDEEGEYLRCLECGARIPWSWPKSAPVFRPPKMAQARVTSFSSTSTLAVVWDAEKQSA